MAEHRAPSGRRRLVTVAVVGALVCAAVVAVATHDDGGSTRATSPAASSTTGAAGPGASPSAAASSSTTAPAVSDPVIGQPWGETVQGILTFRGNPTRTFYGAGPVPKDPKVLWRFPDAPMCSESHDQHGDRVWCGTGWTGQPAVWERDGRTWLAFGGYDRNVHWVDAVTGARLLPDFVTGDLIKGSVTVDPDGYPLLYTGSRDNYYRVIAMDRAEPTELWRLSAHAVSPTKWNDDWDGSGLVVGDYLFEGGENSQLHIVKLNRGYDADGKVTVDPELVFHAPGWDDELLQAIGDEDVSIENSVALFAGTLYFANSGGLVQGWDVSGLAEGVVPTRTFRFWTGDDTDASVVIDGDGMLYVASEYERADSRSREVGQVMKLDPSKPDDPLVWSVADHDANPAGVWATPALDATMVYVATNGGRLLGIDRATGAIVWTKHLSGPTWQSPVVVDDVLIEGDCEGVLHAFDVSDPTVEPPELWQVELGGCIESTPAVWHGRIYVGTRGGRFFAVGDG